MILVDSSVLIDYFKGKDTSKTLKLQYIIENGIQFGITGVIYMELLQGCRNVKEYNLIKSYLKSQTFFNYMTSVIHMKRRL